MYEDPPRQSYWKWTDFLVGFDMFGVRPTLEIHGKRKKKSCWGAFVSIIALLIILVFTLYQALEAQKYTTAGQDLIKSILGEDPTLFYHSYDPEKIELINKHYEEKRKYEMYKNTPYNISEPDKLDEELE